MEDLISEIYTESAPKRKRRSKGFASEETVEEDSKEEIFEEPEPQVEAMPNYHAPLIRPMPAKQSVPRRGVRGATKIRP
jgi:hypothetical protein